MAKVNGTGGPSGAFPTRPQSSSVNGKFADTLNTVSDPASKSTSRASQANDSNKLSRLERGGGGQSASAAVNDALKGGPFEGLPQQAKNEIANFLAQDPRFAERFKA